MEDYVAISCSNKETNQILQSVLIEMIAAISRSPNYLISSETIYKACETIAILQNEMYRNQFQELGTPILITDHDTLIMVSAALHISHKVAVDCLSNPEKWQTMNEEQLSDNDITHLQGWTKELENLMDYTRSVMQGT